MKKVIFFFPVFLLFFISAYSQQSLLYEEDMPVIYLHYWTAGVTIHSSGGMLGGLLGGFDFRRGTHVTGYKNRVWDFEFVKLQNPQEYVSSVDNSGNEYTYGKINEFYVLRAGLGYQHILCSKGDRAGVEIRLDYSAGLSLGITKPVYLYVQVIPANAPPYVDLEPANSYYLDPQQSYVDNIISQAEFTHGLNEIQFHPGGYAKLGLSFDFGKTSDTNIKGVETGVVLDVFPGTIPLMALTSNTPVFFSFYITGMLGKKW